MDVWEAIQRSSLRPRSTDRVKVTEDQEDKLNVLTFGLFVHGGVQGTTVETRKRPWSTRLLTKLVAQTQPGSSFLLTTMSVNTVFKPRKDRNTLERDSFIMGLSKFEGGKLWIEDASGVDFRVVKEGEEPKPGVLQETCHHSVRFNGDPFRGSRCVAVAYTPRGHMSITSEVLEHLQR